MTFYARLTNCLEATVTLDLKLNNMTASTGTPITEDARGRIYFVLTTIQPADPGQRWNYSYTYRWQAGGRGMGGYTNHVYALPYVGERHTVIQGARGSFSHQRGGRDENAIDWEMPVGTQVCAARPGTVVAVRQNSNVGGPDRKYELYCNYVVIRHNDGTFAEYVHLKQNGSLVQVGQKVKLHEPIALSGMTGFTSAPHLHFTVFRNLDGKIRKTIPVEFNTATGLVESVEEGRSYPPSPD